MVSRKDRHRIPTDAPAGATHYVCKPYGDGWYFYKLESHGTFAYNPYTGKWTRMNSYYQVANAHKL